MTVDARSKLPTRVLEIDGDKHDFQLRLVEAGGLHGRYIALSHCWGTDRHIVTNRANLQSHKLMVGFGQLPKTFQDAVIFARALGIHYLWIDSLCIVQDDVQDWKNEAGKMASVYRDAYCTIAATGSQGDQEGMFVDRAAQDVCYLRYNAEERDIMVTYSTLR